MTSVLIGFAVAFATGIIATGLTIPVAKRLGVVDKPDSFRKVHTAAMPLLGGVPLFIATFVPVALLCGIYSDNPIAAKLSHNGLCLKGLLFGSLIALGLGIIDDNIDMRARWKLLLQLTAAGVAFAFGFRIAGVALPFVGTVWLGWLALPATLFWFLACMNAINLMDGLDGLAAGVSLFVVLSLALVCLLLGHLADLFLLACIGGAICGFLVFNFQPGRIFLGDSGSMLLGFLVAALSLQSSRKTETAVALLIPMVALGLPIVDTSMAILRRWSRRLPISAADRRHVHHLLLSLGLSHRKVVLVIYGICLFFGIASVIVATGRNEAVIVVLGSITIIAFVCVRILGGLRFTDLFTRLAEDLEQRKITNDAKVAVEKAAYRLARVRSVDGMWRELCPLFEKLQIDHVDLHLNGASGHECTLNWAAPSQNGHRHTGLPAETWTVRLELCGKGCKCGHLIVRRHMDGRLYLHELPELLTRLRGAMARAVQQLQPQKQVHPKMEAAS